MIPTTPASLGMLSPRSNADVANSGRAHTTAKCRPPPPRPPEAWNKLIRSTRCIDGEMHGGSTNGRVEMGRFSAESTTISCRTSNTPTIDDISFTEEEDVVDDEYAALSSSGLPGS